MNSPSVKLYKTFRVFVSSTFSDLKAERDALQQHVFPRLQDLCLASGCRFQPIDLRWGISTEAGLDNQTMNICLEEIERCKKTSTRPNFVFLLGDRYGWQPLPAEIPKNIFNLILDATNSQTNIDTLNKWYKLDENSVPSLYILQPRQKDTEWENHDYWSKEGEIPLRKIINSALSGKLITEDEGIKYQGSAVHQELQSGLRAEDAKNHVFGYYREISNLKEISQNILPDNLADFVDVDKEGRLDEDLHLKLEDLKDSVETKLGESNIFKYKASWGNDGILNSSIGDLEKTLDDCLKKYTSDYKPQNLCEAVWCMLSKVILQEIENTKRISKTNLERKIHADYRNEQIIKQLPNNTSDKVKEYLENNTTTPFCITGPIGSGKTTLLSDISNRILKNDKFHLIERYIGASADSSNIRSLLTSICCELDESLTDTEMGFSGSFTEIERTFKKIIKNSVKDRTLVIIIDSLEMLTSFDNARKLAWLPEQLNQNIKIIVSTNNNSDNECFKSILNKIPQQNITIIDRISREQGNKILTNWLRQDKRALTVIQKNEVLNKFDHSGLPLFLSLAYNETRSWRSYNDIPTYNGEVGIGNTVTKLIKNILWRLTQPQYHDYLLVTRSLCYLLCSRHGLTEDELLNVLSKDVDVFDQFRNTANHHLTEPKLPVVVWSRLYHDLEPYLTLTNQDGASLITYYHNAFSQVTEDTYLNSKEKTKLHNNLGEYYSTTDKILKVQNGDLIGSSAQRRKSSEQVWQWIQSEEWQKAGEELSDLQFLEYKVKNNDINSVVNELSIVNKKLPNVPLLELYKKSLIENQYALKAKPRCLISIVDFIAEKERRIEDIELLNHQKFQYTKNRNWFQKKYNKNNKNEPSKDLPGGYSLLEKLNFSNNARAITYHELDSKLYVVSSSQIEIIDLALGGIIHSIQSEFPSRYVSSDINISGNLLAISYDNGQLNVFRTSDLSTVLAISSVGGEDVAVSFIGDGHLIHVTNNYQIELVDINTQNKKLLDEYRFEGITYMASTSKAQSIAIAEYRSSNNIKVVKNVIDNPKIVELNGHTSWVNGLCFSQDGDLIASIGNDKKVIIWSIEGEKLNSLDCNALPSKENYEPAAICIVSKNNQCVILMQCGSVLVWNWKQTTENLSFLTTNLANKKRPVGDLAYIHPLSNNRILCSTNVACEILSLDTEAQMPDLVKINEMKAVCLQHDKNTGEAFVYCIDDNQYARWFSISDDNPNIELLNTEVDQLSNLDVSLENNVAWIISNFTTLYSINIKSNIVEAKTTFKERVISGCAYRRGYLAAYENGTIQYFLANNEIHIISSEPKYKAIKIKMASVDTIAILWERKFDGLMCLQLINPSSKQNGPITDISNQRMISMAANHLGIVVSDGKTLIHYSIADNNLRLYKNKCIDALGYSILEYLNNDLLIASGPRGFLDLVCLKNMEIMASIWINDVRCIVEYFPNNLIIAKVNGGLELIKLQK